MEFLNNAERRKIITMDYQQQALDFAKKYGVSLTCEYKDKGDHFKDGFIRDRYTCVLRRGRKSYKFEFTQSANDSKGSHKVKPTMYDVLACMQKYDVGSFDDFCSEFGYNDLPMSAYNETMKTYKAVCKEFESMKRLFSDCMEELQEIQ